MAVQWLTPVNPRHDAGDRKYTTGLGQGLQVCRLDKQSPGQRSMPGRVQPVAGSTIVQINLGAALDIQ